jgi:hypothetical protein
VSKCAKGLSFQQLAIDILRRSVDATWNMDHMVKACRMSRHSGLRATRFLLSGAMDLKICNEAPAKERCQGPDTSHILHETSPTPSPCAQYVHYIIGLSSFLIGFEEFPLCLSLPPSIIAGPANITAGFVLSNSDGQQLKITFMN